MLNQDLLQASTRDSKVGASLNSSSPPTKGAFFKLSSVKSITTFGPYALSSTLQKKPYKNSNKSISLNTKRNAKYRKRNKLG